MVFNLFNVQQTKAQAYVYVVRCITYGSLVNLVVVVNFLQIAIAKS